jgi:hypothetical protein
MGFPAGQTMKNIYEPGIIVVFGASVKADPHRISLYCFELMPSLTPNFILKILPRTLPKP